MLAISLHATNDDLRDELVPLNRRYPIAELLAAVRAYPGLSNARRVTFEYVMLKGVNDSPAEARALVRLLAGHSGQDQPHPVQSLAGRALRMFAPAERSRPSPTSSTAPATPRRSARPRGRDILAACGQLKSASEKPRASARRDPASRGAARLTG